MKTVNSLSGGKTSSYMAVHYPADYEVFALVLIEDKNCTPKDKGLVKRVSDKIGREFIATAENDAILKVMFDLEQMIGRNITWVTGETFDSIIDQNGKPYLPNKMNRSCTVKMKIKPIYEWWEDNIQQVVKMRCGYRYDEMERANNFSTTFKTIVGKSASGLRNKWGEVTWRVGEFPLIENKVFHFEVSEFWKGKHILFPDDSNCVGCFWKQAQQLRKNWDDSPNKMQWFADKETDKRRWQKEFTYEKIKTIGLEQEFQFGTGAGCQAGFCTD